MADSELTILLRLRDQASKGLRDMQSGLRQAGETANTVGQQFKALQASLKSAGDTMTNVGKQMSLKVTAPIVGIGMAAYKLAGDFDTAFRKVNVMLGASAEETENYKARILEISSAVGKSATDVASAYYQIVSAGYRGADSLDILETAMRGATGGAADAAQTTAALTKAMNIFQLQGVEGATRSMDVFFGIVDQGLLSFEELATTFPRAAGMAAGLGVTIEETGAALATLTKISGSTEMAATALNATFNQLITPSTALQKLYEEWGVTNGPEAIRQFGGLAGVLQKVQVETKGEVDQLSELFPNMRAIAAVLPLVTTNSADFAVAMESLGNVTGRTGQAFDMMAQGPGFQLQKSMTEIKNSMIGLGDSLSGTLGPAINTVVNIVKGAVDTFSKLPGPVKSGVIAVTMLAAAIGPALIVIGMMAKGVAALIGLHRALIATKLAHVVATKAYTAALVMAVIGQTAYAAAIKAGVPPAIAFAVAVNAAIWPLTLLVAAIAGVVAGLYFLIKNWQTVARWLGITSEEAEKTRRKLESLNVELKNQTELLESEQEELAKLQDEYSWIQESSAGYRDEVNRLNTAIAEHKLKVEGLQASIRDTEAEIRGLEDALSAARDELRGLSDIRLPGMQESEDQIAAVQFQLNELNLAYLLAKSSGDRMAMRTLKRQIDELETQKAILEATAKVDFDPLLHDLQKASDEALGLTKEMTYEEAMSEIKRLSNEIGGYESQMSDLIGTVEEQKNTLGDWTTELQGFESELAGIFDIVTAALKPLGDEIFSVKENIRGLRLEIESLNESITGTETIESPGFGDAAKNVANLVYRTITPVGMGHQIYDFFKKGQDWSVFWPFGGMAKGGIVDRPTSALIGEAGAEAVIPLTRKDSAMKVIQQIIQRGGPVTEILQQVFGNERILNNVIPLQSGGIVREPALAMLGEAGPEAVIPLGAMRGGGNVTVNVTIQGSVTAERDLASVIRREILKIKSRNYTAGLS